MNYYRGNIYVYNENWEYQRTITADNRPTHSIYINGSIYATADDVINKYDKYLNLIKQINSTGYNRGIYYNSANQMIYTGSISKNAISVYDKDLNYKRTISTNYRQWFITGYNGQMAVTDYIRGNIYFYQGESLFRTVSTLCTGGIIAVLFDNNNQMIVLCEYSNIYIYNVNGTYTGLQVNACNNTENNFVNFDSKDRLVFICDNSIEIFY
jgi:hypothetical protein